MNEFENLVLLVVLPSYQKLINEFILFQCSWHYIFVKRRSFEDNLKGVRKSVIRRVSCKSVEVAALSLAEKVLSEY